MKKKNINLLLVMSMVIFQLMNPSPVLADDETPPESTFEITDDETGEETDHSDVEIGAGDSPPAVPGEINTESKEPTVAQTLELSPEETEIVIVNEEGETEPLATEEAAEIVAQADPVWCPDTTSALTPGANGCSPGFTTMTDLITWLTTNDPNAAGTIWIEDAYDSAAEGVAGFSLDGGSFTNLDNNDLTVQGGWDGASGSTAITGTSSFTGDYLHITNWNSGITINDIIVTGATGEGILITNTGDVSLENVQSNDNIGPGIYVEMDGQMIASNISANGNSTIGAYIDNNETQGNSITVDGTNSFNNNGTIGLSVHAAGDVSVSNITASNNVGGVGASFGKYLLGEIELTLTGTNVFSGNGGYGLAATQWNSVNIENITAEDNTLDGALIFRLGTGEVTISGTNIFNNNGERGLRILLYNGDVQLNNITANGNTIQGLLLESSGGGPFPIASLTLSGTNMFDGNGSHGLEASGISLRGEITLNNVTASNNVGNGVTLDNTASLTNAGITLNGTNVFSNNTGDGLHINTNGNVDVYDVTTSSNDSGLDIVASGDVTVTCGSISNETYGLNVDSASLTLNGVTFSGNGTDISSTSTAVIKPFDCDPEKKATVIAQLSLAIHKFNTAGGTFELNCEMYRGTKLILPNGDFAYFPCPIHDAASMTRLEKDALPAELPDNHTYQSGLTIEVISEGIPSSQSITDMTISFSLPAGQDASSFALIFWDGTTWVEQESFVSADGLSLQAFTNQTGGFVLVSK